MDTEDKHYSRRKSDLDDRFYKIYDKMETLESQLIEALVSEIQIFEERQPSGQWLKSIKFKLPIIEEDVSISLDNETHVETVCLMTRKDT